MSAENSTKVLTILFRSYSSAELANFKIMNYKHLHRHIFHFDELKFRNDMGLKTKQQVLNNAGMVALKRAVVSFTNVGQ